MPVRLLADPDAIALLRFWTERRGGDPAPRWGGDMSELPVHLLPNLAATQRRPEAVFLYVGSECLRRWGAGITGARVYEEVATGPQGRYLRSIGDDALAWQAPVFSAAILSLEGGATATVGRLYAPFLYRSAGQPDAVIGLQIVPPEHRRIDFRRAALAEEAVRLLLKDADPVLAHLEEARRRWRIETAATAALEHARQDADLAAVIHRLTGSSIIRLTPYSAAAG